MINHKNLDGSPAWLELQSQLLLERGKNRKPCCILRRRTPCSLCRGSSIELLHVRAIRRPLQSEIEAALQSGCINHDPIVSFLAPRQPLRKQRHRHRARLQLAARTSCQNRHAPRIRLRRYIRCRQLCAAFHHDQCINRELFHVCAYLQFESLSKQCLHRQAISFKFLDRKQLAHCLRIGVIDLRIDIELLSGDPLRLFRKLIVRPDVEGKPDERCQRRVLHMKARTRKLIVLKPTIRTAWPDRRHFKRRSRCICRMGRQSIAEHRVSHGNDSNQSHCRQSMQNTSTSDISMHQLPGFRSIIAIQFRLETRYGNLLSQVRDATFRFPSLYSYALTVYGVPRELIRRRFFDMIDNKHFYRALLRFELQAELLFKCCEQARSRVFFVRPGSRTFGSSSNRYI